MALVRIAWLLLPVLLLQRAPPTHSYKLVRIRSRGFLPHEYDVLPFAVVKHAYDEQMMQQQHLQLQQPTGSHHPKRTAKQLRSVLVRGVISSRRPELPPPPAPLRQARELPHGYLGGSMWNQLAAGPLRLERSKHDSRQFRIYDAEDGERLLELRFHNGFDKFDPATAASTTSTATVMAKSRSAKRWRGRRPAAPTLTTATTTTTTTADAEAPSTTTTLLDPIASDPTPPKRQKFVQHLFVSLA